MKVTLKTIALIAVTTVVITSCSRKKDNFISRNFHAVTAEYNALFNGYNALEQGRKTLNDSYQDNYWDVLPIERMQIEDEIVLPGQSKNANFTTAEEKAVKAIQKHSMEINGREKNPQIDEAYLLLGKARYFDQRFVPTLDAFNHILYNYPESDKINQAKIWREKTNMRLDNNELAIKNLKRLIEQEELEDQDLADATSMLAQAYINTEAIDSALTQINIAAKHTKNNDERGRYRFIQGQLYNKINDKDSANIAFNKVIDLNRKTPRIYLISAHIEKAKNFDYENGNKLEFIEALRDLEKNRENRPYLDKINHQIAEYYLQNDMDSLAVAYYNKSLRTNSADKILVARNYEILGDINFDNAIYKQAGAYYDSTMLSLVKDSKPFRIIKRKRDNLDDVIYYEDIAKANDSVLKLAALPKAEQLLFINNYIDKLKQQAEKEKLAKEAAERKNQGIVTIDNKNGKTNVNANSSASLSSPGAGRGMPPGATPTFYFYNPSTVAYGKNEFQKVWGDRKNKDNWRWSTNGITLDNNNTTNAILASASDEERFDPEFYIAKIPTETKAIDSIGKERNYAYYQLGLIYKEKFKEYNLAKDRFTALLENNPEEKLILPSKYNLFKIYELLGQNQEAQIAKNDITSHYPESRYALILNNPELAATKDNESPESKYESTYKLFEAQNYQAVIDNSNKLITQFDGDAIVSKFELLKATAIGRLKGFKDYKEAINYVALNFANTPEGLKAQNIVKDALPKLENSTFVPEEDSSKFKAVYTFENASASEIENFNKTLAEATAKIEYYRLRTSIDVYDGNKTFVVVHGLKSISGAKGFSDMLKSEDRYKFTKPVFAISSENYQIVQIHKNLEAYLSSN
ncbi:type IX secretion system periplasmic lipoprotein PorW/SprE [Lacinutrix salivirga]